MKVKKVVFGEGIKNKKHSKRTKGIMKRTAWLVSMHVIAVSPFLHDSQM